MPQKIMDVLMLGRCSHEFSWPRRAATVTITRFVFCALRNTSTTGPPCAAPSAWNTVRQKPLSGESYAGETSVLGAARAPLEARYSFALPGE